MNGSAPSVSLLWLLDGIATLPADEAAGQSMRIDDLTLDSREVRGGTLFFALSGRRAHPDPDRSARRRLRRERPGYQAAL